MSGMMDLEESYNLHSFVSLKDELVIEKTEKYQKVARGNSVFQWFSSCKIVI